MNFYSKVWLFVRKCYSLNRKVSLCKVKKATHMSALSLYLKLIEVGMLFKLFPFIYFFSVSYF